MPVSVKNYFERQSTSALRTDQPMDAGYVWTLIDNIAHLVDVSPKYRINYLQAASAFNDSGYLFNLNSQRPSIAMYFPTTLINASAYPCYDVRVAVSRFGETGDPDVDAVRDIYALIVAPNVDGPITGVGPGVIGTLSGVTPTRVPDALVCEWSIDGLITTGSVSNVPVKPKYAPAVAGLDAVIGEQVWLKLLIEIDEPEEFWFYDENPLWGWISGVQVREYPR